MQTADKGLRRYLQRHLEVGLPEPPPQQRRWHNVLVIPAYREHEILLKRLAQLPRAEDKSNLVILVLNRPASDPDEQANSSLRSALSRLPVTSRQPTLRRLNDHSEIVVYDMELTVGETATSQGVGLARKTGCDIALCWIAAGAIDADWIYSSDADALLPRDYFNKLAACDPQAIAAVMPFHHVPGADETCNLATALYELRMHHYVLGLEYANSPYAHHSLGSCLAVRASAYAKVHGFPRRSGAEDFYLLNKVSKLGPVARPGGTPLLLQSRYSERVPFGTGPAVARIAQASEPKETKLFYQHACFEALRVMLAAVPGLRNPPSVKLATLLESHGLERSLAIASAEAMTHMDLEAALQHCRRQGKSEGQFQRQFHQWFDGFRTLKFIHAIRDAGWPEVSLSSPDGPAPPIWPAASGLEDEVQDRRTIAARHWGWGEA